MQTNTARYSSRAERDVYHTDDVDGGKKIYEYPHYSTFFQTDYAIIGKSTRDWMLYPITRLEIEPPEPVIDLVDVPGSDYALDLTESLTGRPIYKQRECDWVFIIVAPRNQWDAIYSDVMNRLHGRRMKVVRMEEPDYYYEGRITIESTKSDKWNGHIKMHGVFDPYKRNVLASDDDWLWDPFSFEDGYIPYQPNIYAIGHSLPETYKSIVVSTDSPTSILFGETFMPTSPTINVLKPTDSVMTLQIEGEEETVTLNDGDNRIPGILGRPERACYPDVLTDKFNGIRQQRKSSVKIPGRFAVMYSIYINNEDNTGEHLLYSPTNVDEGAIVLEPKLKMEINKAMTLEFLLPPTNPLYGDIAKLKTTITLYDGSTLKFRGRCRETKKSFNKCVEYTCSSELSFLGDVDTEPYNNGDSDNTKKTVGGWIAFFLEKYNAQAKTARKIQPGNTTDGGSTTFKMSNDGDSTVFDEIMAIAEARNGIIETRREGGTTYLDFRTVKEADRSTQIIEFGKNLIDFEQFVDATEIVTHVKAYDKDNAHSVTATNTTAETTYGTRVHRVMRWDMIEDQTTLQSMANSYVNAAYAMAATITLEAVDLHLIKADEQQFRLGYENRMLSPPHGVDEWFLCSRIELDLTKPAKNKYVFGATRATLTEKVTYKPTVLRG
uniref:Tail spike domain-containing protein n=1 Tax=unidentified microorganism TaxID=81726 RepID=Q2YI80_9ZZZZ|nr:hypothetical protein [unidentified microorganism]